MNSVRGREDLDDRGSNLWKGLRNEYLVAENRVLRNQLQGRLRLTDGERRSLAEIGKRLGKQALDKVASIVNPDTVLGWHRRRPVQKHKRTQDWRAGPFRSSSPRGEPQIWGVSEAMSAIRVLRTRRENTVQQRDTTLPGGDLDPGPGRTWTRTC